MPGETEGQLSAHRVSIKRFVPVVWEPAPAVFPIPVEQLAKLPTEFQRKDVEAQSLGSQGSTESRPTRSSIKIFPGAHAFLESRRRNANIDLRTRQEHSPTSVFNFHPGGRWQ